MLQLIKTIPIALLNILYKNDFIKYIIS